MSLEEEYNNLREWHRLTQVFRREIDNKAMKSADHLGMPSSFMPCSVVDIDPNRVPLASCMATEMLSAVNDFAIAGTSAVEMWKVLVENANRWRPGSA